MQLGATEPPRYIFVFPHRARSLTLRQGVLFSSSVPYIDSNAEILTSTFLLQRTRVALVMEFNKSRSARQNLTVIRDEGGTRTHDLKFHTTLCYHSQISWVIINVHTPDFHGYLRLWFVVVWNTSLPYWNSCK